MSDYCVVLCTCPDISTAEQLANLAVEKHLAACVNIINGIRSVYLWEGEIQQDNECQLVLKTLHCKTDELFELVLSRHPYDVPEWLILDVSDGSKDYLNWIKRSIK